MTLRRPCQPSPGTTSTPVRVCPGTWHTGELRLDMTKLAGDRSECRPQGTFEMSTAGTDRARPGRCSLLKLVVAITLAGEFFVAQTAAGQTAGAAPPPALPK